MPYTGSQAQAGYGSILAINTGTVSTPAYTAVGEVIDPKQSGYKNLTDDVTNLQSTAEEFIATLLSPGNWQFTLNRVVADAGQVAMLASFNAKTLLLYKVSLPLFGAQTVADSYTFKALVEEYGITQISPKKAIQITGSLKVSGATTFAAGS